MAHAFFNLNQRFHNLLTNSTLLIKINLSSISKSALQRYYKDIIIRNRHRINLLRLSNLFIYDHSAFLLFHKILKFRRLETLILDNIESYCLENLLYQLTSSPFLSSLIITSVIDNVINKNTIYRQIFRLPALKYCKLSLKGSVHPDPLPVATNEYSPVEHLIINNTVRCEQLNSLISYVPQLRRLSFYSLHKSYRK
ncbi:unnamed protein product [Rotaria sordida]|uniref:Uncharacterized protein n=1 Tax=Rotaria sordida TaxID=392033 RepID=A0A818QXH8_9BILA|nr:unnamed protein product [Rotaria sordida]